MKNKYLEEIINGNETYRKLIFERGFLVTNNNIDIKAFPVLKDWIECSVCDCRIFVHPDQKCFICDNRVLIGHAYNPFSMETDENQILKNITKNILNQLTGIFTVFEVKENGIKFVGDATCMQCVYYTISNNFYYISSHSNLIGEILHLDVDPYIKKLIGYRFFPLFGFQLPGDLSLYECVKRLVPNHYAEIKDGKAVLERFFLPHTEILSENDIVDKVSEILHNNLDLITKKWRKPAISLTGGCDSKTTLSCANGLFEKFSYFSYVSSEEERVDAIAAHNICNALNLRHEIYEIPGNDFAFPNIEKMRTLLRYNCGDAFDNNRNDVRKRVWLLEHQTFDVEVKSWVSEIGRAYYSKRFCGRQNFGKVPSPRKCSTLYKVFFYNRRLLRKTDRVFADYLKSFFDRNTENPIAWQEQFFWEFRVPAWNALVITHEHQFSSNITIPYNNRILLGYLLDAPIKDRISDKIYADVRKKMDERIDNLGINVTNIKHTRNRAIVENAYYVINNILP